MTPARLADFVRVVPAVSGRPLLYDVRVYCARRDPIDGWVGVEWDQLRVDAEERARAERDRLTHAAEFGRAEAEREIVAWLRERADAWWHPHDEATAAEDRVIADAIEAGEHRKAEG